jgi:hypothetical protein
MGEMCSTHNRRESVFTTGLHEVKESAYFGIDCTCSGTQAKPKDGEKCEHTFMVMDAKIIDYVVKSSADGVKQVKSATTEAFESKTEE